MTGSIKTVQYDGNNGVLYAMRRDESNARASVGGGVLITNSLSSSTLPGLPCNVKPRIIRTINKANPNTRKTFTCGSLVVFNTLKTGDTIVTNEYYNDVFIGTFEWFITYLRGEITKGYNPVDTLQTDQTRD